MKIIKCLPATCVLLIGSSVILASGASVVPQTSTNNNWYVGARGGVNIPDDSNQEGLKTSFNTGYNALVEAGYWFDNNIALEAQTGYLYSSVKDQEISGSVMESANGYTGLWLGMFNAYYGFKNSSHLMPYLGVGAGLAALHNNWRFNTPIDSYGDTFGGAVSGTQLVFAYQAMVGLAYNVNQNWSISLDYRYLGTSSASFNAKASVNTDNLNIVQNVKYNANLVTLGVAYHF